MLHPETHGVNDIQRCRSVLAGSCPALRVQVAEQDLKRIVVVLVIVLVVIDVDVFDGRTTRAKVVGNYLVDHCMRR